ncbi:hypothetical protein PLICRDRAFT_123037 [Plicaturopsis crispa FD-325 SS-3]|nr:hypothetical protein PLICRDRAFT_123037 [Plicaturopsis crispa FD-325 SS-3]
MTSFFSRDNMSSSLKRSAAIRSRKPNSLQVIPELSEPEDIASTSATSPPAKRAIRRRRESIRIITPDHISLASCPKKYSPAHDFVPGESIFTIDRPPRPAPSPPTSATSSPPSSPDSFQLAFPGVGPLDFPHPPTPFTPTASPSPSRSRCQSPTRSLFSRARWQSPSFSSPSSSPESDTTGLPTTPSSSDDEFPRSVPFPSLRPRRASIRPLSIVKHASRTVEECGVWGDDEAHMPCADEQDVSCIEAKDSDDAPSDNDSDASSDSGNAWYNREFNEILSLTSIHNHHGPARPESIYIPRTSRRNSTIEPRGRTRMSKPLPNIPVVDPAFPSPSSQRRSRQIPAMPKRAPPPPPIMLRPPPRSAVPDDVEFECEIELEDDASNVCLIGSERDDVSNVFLSGSGSPDAFSFSSASSYSQDGSSCLEEAHFDVELDADAMDAPLRLPLSLPSSPVDLELDIAMGLEELALARERGQLSPLSPFSLSDYASTPVTERAPQQEPTTVHTQMATVPTEYPQGRVDGAQDRVLRSRWSSSTLSSIPEQGSSHGLDFASGLRSPASKLKFYFGSAKKRGMKAPGPGSVRKTTTSPKTPPSAFKIASPNPYKGTSPAFSMKGHTARGLSIDSAAPMRTPMSPAFSARRSADGYPASPSPSGFARGGGSPGSSFSFPSSPSGQLGRGRSSGSPSGYGSPSGSPGLQRQSSRCSSSAASDSGESTGSAGLRRKPIPVEMFLRC